MPFLFVVACLILLVPFSSKATLNYDQPSPTQVKFVKNLNQWDKDVLYRADLPGGFLFIKSSSLHYVFYDTKAMGRIHAHGSEHGNAKQALSAPESKQIQAHGFEVHFEGASTNAIIETSSESIDKKNFFLGNDPSRWAAGVPSFTQVIYKNIYPGIDLKLYTQHATLKYDFIVSPKADASKIKLRYEGADQIQLQEGFLQIRTSVNTVTETKPYSYQPVSGIEQEIPAEFKLQGNILQFSFPKGYNASLPLVIDPVLVFSTYSGSFTDNWGFTATFDNEGNLYSGGIEFGTRFPVTTGVFQFTFAGEIDVALLKFSPDGKRLLYATYLGGSASDVPHSMIVNASNELIVMGTTSSLNFPFSMDAYDKNFNGGPSIDPLGNNGGITYDKGSDIFITKFNAAGNGVVGSTFVGGSGNDGINSINDLTRSYGDQFRGEVNIDENGNIYIASTTFSEDFPLMNPAQGTLQGGQDAIVCKFSPSLSRLLWSTYFGGSGADAASGIRTGKSGSIYIGGGTSSQDLPVQPTAIKPDFTDSEDGYVAKFTNNTLIASTYVGTNTNDIVALIDLDAFENVYVMGITFGDYPLAGKVYNNPGSSQFIHAISSDFSETIFSTVIGSGRNTPDLSPTAFQVSNCGYIYLSGWGGLNGRNISGMPTTSDALRRTTSGDDFYLMIMDTQAAAVLYGTYFGSTRGTNHVDGGTSRFDKKGIIYHAACACRDNSSFPTTAGAWSQRNNGNNANIAGTNDGCNNAAFKFDLDITIDPPVELCYGDSITLQASGGSQFEWTPATGLSDPFTATPIASPDQTTTYTVSITDALGCVRQRSVRVEVSEPIPVDFDLTISSECGKPATVRFVNNSAEGDQILWIMGNGDTLTTTPDSYNYDIEGGTYEVVLTVFKGLCKESLAKTIQIENNQLPPNIITPNGDTKNETFIAPNIGSKLEIYNRWGKPIYQSDSYQNNWGQEVPNGVYYYLITSPTGTRCKGWIHVLY
jgi:gliding motility-associated-like protein